MKEPARYEVMYEDMNTKLDAIFEIVQGVPRIETRVTILEEKVDRIQDSFDSMELVVKDHSVKFAKIEQAVK